MLRQFMAQLGEDNLVSAYLEEVYNLVTDSTAFTDIYSFFEQKTTSPKLTSASVLLSALETSSGTVSSYWKLW